MNKTSVKETILEPILTGDLNERFCKAVHEEPVLFYDVVQTGRTTGNVPYEIVLLHGNNVDNKVLESMMALQDKVAFFADPHPDNMIDYKDEAEVIGHYSDSGLGLGIFTVSGALIGQAMLSFKNKTTGPFSTGQSETQANINWLMVDPEHRCSGLFGKLIDLAFKMAESSGMTQINANVRLHNVKGASRFTEKGFIAIDNGINAKDGSRHLSFCKLVKSGNVPGHKM